MSRSGVRRSVPFAAPQRQGDSGLNIRAILLDLGDTIMVEATEVKDDTLTTLEAELVVGMGRVLKELKARGYALALVADTRRGTYWNVLRQHGLYDLFDAFAISDEVGAEKPDPIIFENALSALEIEREDYHRVLMVGNNLQRDIRGANALGLVSIWFHWNDRYRTHPIGSLEEPRYVIHSAEQLLDMVDDVERKGARREGGAT